MLVTVDDHKGKQPPTDIPTGDPSASERTGSTWPERATRPHSGPFSGTKTGLCRLTGHHLMGPQDVAWSLDFVPVLPIDEQLGSMLVDFRGDFFVQVLT